MNLTISPEDALVPVQMRNETVKFLADTGAMYSVVTSCRGPLSKFYMPVVGATGKRQVKPFLQPMECKIGNKVLTHEFICQNAPYLL